MTIGAALLLIAVGAILRFAVATVATHGFDLHTIGDILMVVGILGLCLSLIMFAASGRGRGGGSGPGGAPPPPPGYRPSAREPGVDEYDTQPYRR